MTMNIDVKTFVSTVGRSRIRDALGVNNSAIGDAIARGSFPSSWYFILKDISDKDCISCPKSLFNFKDFTYSK